MDIKLRVDVNGEYGTFAAGITVPEQFVKCFEPLKTCDEPIFEFMNNEISPIAGRVVMGLKKDAAKTLSEKLTLIIIDAMEKNDTHNGYPCSPTTFKETK